MKKLNECTMQELIAQFYELRRDIFEIETSKNFYRGLVRKRQKNEESLIKYLCTEVEREALNASYKNARTRYAYLVIRENNADKRLQKLIKYSHQKYSEILKDFYFSTTNEITRFIELLESGIVETYEDALYIFKKNIIKKE